MPQLNYFFFFIFFNRASNFLGIFAFVDFFNGLFFSVYEIEIVFFWEKQNCGFSFVAHVLSAWLPHEGFFLCCKQFSL